MSKIFFYVTGYLFSETSLKTNMRKTKSLIIYLRCTQEIDLGLLCHTALAWLFPWGQATTWQIRNWSRQLILCGPSACIHNYHPLKLWLLAACCSFLHCLWPGGAGYLPTVLPWRYPTQTHSPQPALKPTGKFLRSLLEQCLLIFLLWVGIESLCFSSRSHLFLCEEMPMSTDLLTLCLF